MNASVFRPLEEALQFLILGLLPIPIRKYFWSIDPRSIEVRFLLITHTLTSLPRSMLLMRQLLIVRIKDPNGYDIPSPRREIKQLSVMTQ